MSSDPRAAAQAYLHARIPVSAAMQVEVRAVDEAGVRLWAPLSANVNHQSTIFGGSAAALAILSGWTYVWARLRTQEIPSGLVIQRGVIEYLRPLHADFEAFCAAPPPAEWQRFVATLRKRSRARLLLDAEVLCEGERGGTFRGTYVASLEEKEWM